MDLYNSKSEAKKIYYTCIIITISRAYEINNGAQFSCIQYLFQEYVIFPQDV